MVALVMLLWAAIGFLTGATPAAAGTVYDFELTVILGAGDSLHNRCQGIITVQPHSVDDSSIVTTVDVQCTSGRFWLRVEMDEAESLRFFGVERGESPLAQVVFYDGDVRRSATGSIRLFEGDNGFGQVRTQLRGDLVAENETDAMPLQTMGPLWFQCVENFRMDPMLKPNESFCTAAVERLGVSEDEFNLVDLEREAESGCNATEFGSVWFGTFGCVVGWLSIRRRRSLD